MSIPRAPFGILIVRLTYAVPKFANIDGVSSLVAELNALSVITLPTGSVVNLYY